MTTPPQRPPMIRPHQLDNLPLLNPTLKEQFKSGLAAIWHIYDTSPDNSQQKLEATNKIYQASRQIMQHVSQKTKPTGLPSPPAQDQQQQQQQQRPQMNGQNGSQMGQPQQNAQQANQGQSGQQAQAQQGQTFQQKLQISINNMTVYPDPNVAHDHAQSESYKLKFRTQMMNNYMRAESARALVQQLQVQIGNLQKSGQQVPEDVSQRLVQAQTAHAAGEQTKKNLNQLNERNRQAAEARAQNQQQPQGAQTAPSKPPGGVQSQSQSTNMMRTGSNQGAQVNAGQGQPSSASPQQPQGGFQQQQHSQQSQTQNQTPRPQQPQGTPVQQPPIPNQQQQHLPPKASQQPPQNQQNQQHQQPQQPLQHQQQTQHQQIHQPQPHGPATPQQTPQQPQIPQQNFAQHNMGQQTQQQQQQQQPQRPQINAQQVQPQAQYPPQQQYHQNTPTSTMPQNGNPAAQQQQRPTALSQRDAMAQAAQSYRQQGDQSGTPQQQMQQHPNLPNGLPFNQPQSATQHTPTTGFPPNQQMSSAQTKFPIPKNLALGPQTQTPVSGPPSRPTMMGQGGMMNVPGIQKPPPFTLEGEGDHVLSKRKLDELMRQITGSANPADGLTPEVEEAVLSQMDNFVEMVITKACQLAKLRQGQTLDIRDVQMVLERNYGIRIPGYSLDEVRTVRKFQPAPGWVGKVQAVQAAKVMGGNKDS